MKQQILLKQFEYSIPTPGLVLAGLKKNHIVAVHHPLMKIKIDFEKGNLKLDGDCLSFCSGLLGIGNIRGTNSFISDQWISVFICTTHSLINGKSNLNYRFMTAAKKSGKN